MAESVIGLFNTEVIHMPGPVPWKSASQLEWETAKWIHWTTTQRVHSAT